MNGEDIQTEDAGQEMSFTEMNALHRNLSDFLPPLPEFDENNPEAEEATKPRPDLNTELGLQMIDYNAFNENDSAVTELKHVRDYLVSNKLVVDETEILHVEPPFATLETHFNAIEEYGQDESEKIKKEEEKDEEFDIKCTICPKVNSDQGHKIFDIIHREQNNGEPTKRLTPATEFDRLKMSLVEGLLDEAVSLLGSDWKLIIDYMTIHPFHVEVKKSHIEIYKERLEK